MVTFPSRARTMAQRYGIMAVVIAFVGGSMAIRAQGTDSDEPQAPTQIAATHTPSAFTQPIHAETAAVTERWAAAERGGDFSSYDLGTFWRQADIVAQGTLFCLALMLIGASYVLIRRLWDQQIVLRNAQTVNKSFWTAPNLYAAVRNLESDSAFRAIAEHGLEAATHREGRLTDRIAVNEWIAMSLQRSVGSVNANLRRGLAFVEAVGSTAPFVGLFGTAWGIHRALSGAAGDDRIAAPIGAALVLTAAGLVVTVLTVLGYRLLLRRHQAAIDAVRDFARDVQAVLLAPDVAMGDHRRS